MKHILHNKAIRSVLTIIVGLALLGGAFYGGRVYQNNTDQKLFAEYNPPQTNTGSGRGTAFGGFGGGLGGGGSQNAQIAAALTVGTPPSSTSANAGTSSSSSSGQNGGVSLVPQQGAASTTGGQRPLLGQLVSLTGGKLTVQGFQGQQSLPTTARTHYYQVTSAGTSALSVGQHVAVSTDPADASTAASVTIAPSSDLFVRVRSFGGGAGSGGFGGGGGGSGNGGGGGFGSGSGGGGFGSGSGSGGGFGSGGGSGSGGGFGSGGGSGSGGFAGGGSGSGGGFGGARRAAGLNGTITAVSNGTLTVATTQGASKTVKLAASTRVYRAITATPGQFKAGSFVTARLATVNGQQVAADVVQSTVSGAIASITS